MALLAAPVIIHLINRMRYRTVRFAAMEFLLQSEQRNRRRLLLEQLLLLLLRILIVLAIVMLIARLILDPGQLSLFRGTKSHHVVLLDDSLSMRERRGETTAFAEALKIINELASEGHSGRIRSGFRCCCCRVPISRFSPSGMSTRRWSPSWRRSSIRRRSAARIGN